MAWERVTTPFEKYVFHYLPGIPVLIGLCIVLRSDIEDIGKDLIPKLPPNTNDLLGFTFFLILLIMVLFTVFLLAMLVDAVRHMFEYALLTLGTEYYVADHIYDEKTEDLERKFNVITKYHETEYFYTEFFGNAAFSLLFLWGVMQWYGVLPLKSSSPKPLKPHFLFVWMHIVFILRAFSSLLIWEYRANSEKNSEKKEQNYFWKRTIDWLKRKLWNKLNDWLKKVLKNLWHSILDFWATILSIMWLLLWWFFCSRGTASPQAFHYYFIMTLVIMSSFEVYIFRFRRFEKTLEGILRKKNDNKKDNCQSK